MMHSIIRSCYESNQFLIEADMPEFEKAKNVSSKYYTFPFDYVGI